MHILKISMRISVLAIVFAVANQASALETYYVQSVKAKIYSAPSFKASVLGETGRGTMLTASGREGNWVKVGFRGKDGFVAAILLSSSPPMAKLSMIKADSSEFQSGVRRRASTYTSAAAARGLAADDRRRLSGEDKLDYDALERVERFTVSDSDLARFLEGGKI